MSRERVIVDIENLEQALRLEQTVRTGYCDPIAENLLAWIAVEEDLATSYDKLSERHSNKAKEEIRDLSVQSRSNIEVLRRILESIEGFAKAREKRERLIYEMIERRADS